MYVPEFINEFDVVYKPTKLQLGRITKPLDCVITARNLIGESNIYWQEFLYVFYTNRMNQVISYKCLSFGGRTGTLVDYKIMFAYALKTGAEGLFLLHNHPSGNLEPSPQDLRMFRKAVEIGNLLDISVHDSLIIAPEKGYYSTVNETKFNENW